jgi:hypothetical protein
MCIIQRFVHRGVQVSYVFFVDWCVCIRDIVQEEQGPRNAPTHCVPIFETLQILA